MKRLIFIFLFLIPATGFSENKRPIVGEVTQQKESPGTEGSLKKLLAIQGVDTQYANCSKSYSPKDSNYLQSVSNCLWNGDQNAGIPKLSDDLRKKVQQTYALEQQEENRDQNRRPASASSLDLTKKSKQLSVDYMSDPAVVKLSESFQKKLEAALIGDEQQQKDKKTVAIVDHEKFVELYRTELGKTIVNSFTSYCLEVDYSNKFETTNQDCKDTQGQATGCPIYLISGDKKSAIKKNIDKLHKSDFVSDSSDWTGCIASVTNVCYLEASKITPNISVPEMSDSREKACLIMDYVKSARKNLIALDAQSEFYKKLKGGVGLKIGNQRNIAINDKNSIDAITTVTSKDIEDAFEPESKKLKKEMEKCINDQDQVVDMEACKKYLSTDSDKKKKEMAEFSLRQFAQEATLEDKLKDRAEVEKYLKNEGYADSNLNQMLKDDQSVKKVSDEIMERYKKEREAIIQSMAKRIGNQTSTIDGSISPDDDKQKLINIRNEFNSRPEDLKQLVHFNNIVSSYINIESGGQKSRNVASLFQELNNGAKNIGNNNASQITKDLTKKANEAGLVENKNSQDSSTKLDVKDINGLLKYSTEK